MATVASLPTRGLSEAKAALSDVMSGVVHDHQPTVIERHGGKEAMLLLGLSDMGPLLDHFSFHTLSSVSDGEFVLRQEELDLVAGGDTFDQAAAELEEPRGHLRGAVLRALALLRADRSGRADALALAADPHA